MDLRIDPNSVFDSDAEIGESSSESSEEEDPATNERKYYSNLSVEDDFLLVLMKLRLALSTIDLAVVRFNVSEGTVSKLFTTWINYVYVRFGDLKISPQRNVVIANMPPNFLLLSLMQQNLQYKPPHPFSGSPKLIPATSQQTHLKA